MPTIKLTGLSSIGQITGLGDTDDAQLDGGLVVGNADTDSIVINAEFDSDLIPDDDATYDLGSETKRWNNIAAVAFYGDGSNLTGVGGEPAGNDGSVQYNDNGVLDGSGMLYYKSGRVGVGDFEFDNPDNLLHIKGNFGGGQTHGTVAIEDFSFSPSIYFNRHNGDSQNISGVSDSDVLGGLYFRGYNSNSNGLQVGAQIRAIVDGSPSNSSSDMPASLRFETTPDGQSTVSTRMIIKPTGRVGIGTLSPTFQLDVEGSGIRTSHSAGAMMALGLDSLNPFSGSLLGQLRFGGTTQSQNSANIEAYTGENWGSSYGSYLLFNTTQNGSTTPSETMRLSQGGITLKTSTEIEGSLDVDSNLTAGGYVDSDTYMRVHSNTGYFKVAATNTGVESKLSLSTLETGSVYANAYLTNSNMNSAITNMITMMAWSSTDNAIQMNATGKSARFEVYDDNSQAVIAVNEDGKTYIGTVDGEAQHANFEFQTTNGVHIEGNDSDSVALTVVNRSQDNNSDGVAIIIGLGARSNSSGTYDYPTTSNSFLKFYSKTRPYGTADGATGVDADRVPELIGSIRGDDNGGVAYYQSFTGLHASVIDTVEVNNGAVTGMIVESTGKIWHSSTGDNISTALPKVTLSTSSNSKRVFGVISSLEGTFDGYVSASPLKDSETHIEVNSLGEGRVWVTNINGNIENGDYITSSNIRGYGQGQDDDLLHSYTVAKCIEDIDWDSVSDTIEHNGQPYKKYLTACTYHCG